VSSGWLGRSAAVVLFLILTVSAPAPAAAAAPGTPRLGGAAAIVTAASGVIDLDGSRYRGRLLLSAEGGSVRVVNEVSVEDYMLGIREMPPSWPIEAQRAQAVAARSYALNRAAAARAAGRPFDLCATPSCQVYGGVASEERGGPIWSEAVRSTAGQVLLHKGAPILAMYSSSNGGRTYAGPAPYLRPVADPDDARSPLHRWRVEVPETAIGAAVQLPEGAHLTSVERSGSTVVAKWIEVPEDPQAEVKQGSRPVPVTDFRARLEAAHPAPRELPRLLPSPFFGLAEGSNDDHIAIEGGGWGHGIGLSQYGALGKSLRGMKAPQILASYYSGIRPTAGPADLPPILRVDLGLVAAARVGASGTMAIDSAGLHEGTSPSGAAWELRAKGGRLVLRPPSDWAPTPAVSLPTTPLPADDPFVQADPEAQSPLRMALSARPPTTGSGRPVVPQTLAAALLAAVGWALQREARSTQGPGLQGR
jgi:stage II sporulation protein D